MHPTTGAFIRLGFTELIFNQMKILSRIKATIGTLSTLPVAIIKTFYQLTKLI